MVVTYYVKHFRTGANKHNCILMSLLFLVAEAKDISTTEVTYERDRISSLRDSIM